MADPDSSSAQTQRTQRSVARSPIVGLVQKFREHAPNSGKLVALLALLIIGTVLLLLTVLTVTVTVTALVFFAPLIIICSPIWIPLGIFLFLAAAAVFSTCGFVAAGSSWVYKLFRRHNRSGSYRVESPRSRVREAASHLKDYAVEYGGYLQSKGKDAAPGA